MLKFTVVSAAVRELNGTSAKSGKAYALRFQTVYAHTVDRDGVVAPFPEKLEVILDTGAQPYAPGDYTLHPSAVYVDQNGRLACSPRLVPVKRVAAAA